MKIIDFTERSVSMSNKKKTYKCEKCGRTIERDDYYDFGGLCWDCYQEEFAEEFIEEW